MSIPMTGDELKEIRQALRMNRKDFARALGFRGLGENVYRTVKRLESGYSDINDDTAALARSLAPKHAIVGNDPREG